MTSVSTVPEVVDTKNPSESSQTRQLESSLSAGGNYDAFASLINVALQQSSDKDTSESAVHQFSDITDGTSVDRPQVYTIIGPSTTDHKSSDIMDGISLVRPQDHSIIETSTATTNDGTSTHVSQSVATITHSDSTLTGALSATGSNSLPTFKAHASGEAKLFLTLGDVTATLTSGSVYVAGSQTLTPGGPAITLSGTPISLESVATAVVMGSRTSGLTTPPRIGDYIWAGLAGLLLPAESSTILASESTQDITSEVADNAGTVSPQHGVVIVSTADDGSVVVDIMSLDELTISSRDTLPQTPTSNLGTKNATTKYILPSEAIDESISAAATRTSSASTPSNVVSGSA